MNRGEWSYSGDHTDAQGDILMESFPLTSRGGANWWCIMWGPRSGGNLFGWAILQSLALFGVMVNWPHPSMGIAASMAPDLPMTQDVLHCLTHDIISSMTNARAQASSWRLSLHRHHWTPVEVEGVEKHAIIWQMATVQHRTVGTTLGTIFGK